MNQKEKEFDPKKFIRELGFDTFFNMKKKFGYVPEKSSLLSTKFREEGNKFYTNKKHSEQIHKSILTLYSKSIAFAPNASEELALGYNNRSVLLKHFKKYKESIKDINKALQITRSDKLIQKLGLRKKNCLQLINDPSNQSNLFKLSKDVITDVIYFQNELEKINKFRQHIGLTDIFSPIPDTCATKNLELPKITPSKNLPCIADCAELKYNQIYGRHIVASRDIKPGEIVAIEKGFVVYPRKMHVYVVCTYCLNFTWNGLPCDTCSCVIYCSEKCKEAAWLEYHDVECNILPFLNCKICELVDISHSISTARLFIKAVKSEGLENVINEAKAIDDDKDVCVKKCNSNKSFCYEKFHSIYNMANHKEICNTKDDDKFYCSMLFFLLNKYTNIFDNLTNSIKSKESLKIINLFIKNMFIKLKNILDTNSYGFQIKPYDCIEEHFDNICKQCDDNYLGTILVPASCLINHSCVPNLSRIFTKDGKIVLFSCSPIKQGEQLLTSYGPSRGSDKSIRNNYLRETFYFSCNCQACLENWTTRNSSNTFQELFAKEPEITVELMKLCSDKDVSLFSLFNHHKEYFSEKALSDNIKIVEMAYENYDPMTADSLSIKCKYQIHEIFENLYGMDYKIPDEC